jgi:hypothetical protein
VTGSGARLQVAFARVTSHFGHSAGKLEGKMKFFAQADDFVRAQ